MTANSNWIQSRPATGSPRLRLFCLPHAGGGASAFQAWSAVLPADVQIAPVRLPGRETRISESPFDRIEPLVDAISREMRPWLDMPFAIFGHSMGALLAYEWVRRLQDEGRSMPNWLFLSGRRAPDIPADEFLGWLDDDAFIEALTHRYQGIPKELLQNPELMSVFLPILRADIGVVESHRAQRSQPLNCPITVAAGLSDGSVTYEQLIGWKRHAAGGFSAHLFPGGHFYPQAPLLKIISATLNPQPA